MMAEKYLDRSSAVLAALLLAGATAVGVAQAQLPPAQTANGIQYVTGGFGQEESSAFKQARSNYALALTFAVSGAGSASSPYAGNVQVLVRNAQGGTVLNATSTGPYFLVNLEPGTYRLDATYEGDTQSREVAITQGKTADLKFTWKRPAAGPD